MEPVQFHSRTAVGLGIPTNTTGSVRRILQDNLPIHTIHYTGVPVTSVFFSGGDGVFSSIEDVYKYLLRVEQVARGSGKPFEYNTIIPVMADGSAHVVAYADEYMAAHSAGENDFSHGTQFSTGIGQKLNEGARLAFRWWHAVLEATGRLAPGNSILPHKEMPGAKTACPGESILADWRELTKPYVVIIPPEEEEPTNPPENENPSTPPNGGLELMSMYQVALDYAPGRLVCRVTAKEVIHEENADAAEVDRRAGVHQEPVGWEELVALLASRRSVGNPFRQENGEPRTDGWFDANLDNAWEAARNNPV